jgi:ribonuclease BN (tRNA processing enzyme)
MTLAGAAGSLSSVRIFAQSRAQGGTRLVLLGTQAGPNIELTRNEMASLLVAGGQPYLVDCGYGALRGLVQAGVNYRDVAHVFLTHLHDDHTSDLSALLSHQWNQWPRGRKLPTTIHGPHGTSRWLDGFFVLSEANASIRMADEGRPDNPSVRFRAADLSATDAPVEVLKDITMKVTSIGTTHYPASTMKSSAHRALAYRFDAVYRSIVFSGDTAYSDRVIELARGAEVFVCEVVEFSSARRWFEGMVAKGRLPENAEGIWKHIVATHCSPEDVGKMARAAAVRTVVLSHIFPGAAMDVPDESYAAGVRRVFSGEVIVGRDQMIL